MPNIARQSGFVTEARQAARQFWQAHQTLEKLQAEWNALDYGTTLEEAAFGGENAPLSAADVGAVVFATADAVRGLLGAGHATNLAKLL
jgi:hypothetical protein